MERRQLFRALLGGGLLGGILSSRAKADGLFVGTPGISTPRIFGAVGDGTANDTVAVQAFLTSLRDGGIGSWDNKSYKINEGVLILSPTSVTIDTIGPIILGSATFIAAGFADAPMLQIKNPDVVSGTVFYREGNFGNIKFVDSVGSGSNRHGLDVSGLIHWRGSVTGSGLHGAVVHVPTRTFSGTGDPYEVFGCNFSITCYSSVHAFLNENGPDGGGVSSDCFNCNFSTGDSWVSSGGQGTTLRNLSVGSAARGIVFTSVGTSNRTTLDMAEIDICKTTGLDIGRLDNFIITRFRMAMRNATETGFATWPTSGCIKLGSHVLNGYINATIKLAPGVTPSNVLPVLDCTNSAGIANVVVDLDIDDETLLFPADARSLGNLLVANIVNTAAIDIKINGLPYVRQNSSDVLTSYLRAMTVTARANTDFTLSIPQKMLVHDISVLTDTAFGATTDAKIQIGSSVGASDFVAPTSIKAKGKISLPLTVVSGSWLFNTRADVPNIFIRIVQTGALSATGRCTLTIRYSGGGLPS